MFAVEKLKCLDGTTKCPILKKGRLPKVNNLTTKCQIFDSYHGGDDALDRILDILQEYDDDEDAQFEGFLLDLSTRSAIELSKF